MLGFLNPSRLGALAFGVLQGIGGSKIPGKNPELLEVNLKITHDPNLDGTQFQGLSASVPMSFAEAIEIMQAYKGSGTVRVTFHQIHHLTILVRSNGSIELDVGQDDCFWYNVRVARLGRRQPQNLRTVDGNGVGRICWRPSHVQFAWQFGESVDDFIGVEPEWLT